MFCNAYGLIEEKNIETNQSPFMNIKQQIKIMAQSRLRSKCL